MRKDGTLIKILIADDDQDDQLLIRKALKSGRLVNQVKFVDNGEMLMDYLYRKGDYEELSGEPLPGLILLDLNMPVMDGREALKEIKTDKALRKIPVVVLTTSKAEEDILKTYDLGVNSFITKPVTFESLSSVLRATTNYWFEIVELPSEVQTFA